MPSIVGHTPPKRKWPPPWTIHSIPTLLELYPRDILFGAQHRKKKNYAGRQTLPTSFKEKETHWLKRAVSPLHRKK
eukprot:1064061-Pelagomonas_calceolata.AAC.1